jgi:hypothetical protein
VARGDDAKRILAQRVLIGCAMAVAVVCFVLGTPDDAPAYALDSNLILRFERAAVPVALLLGLGGLAVRLWLGDKVSETQVPAGPGLSAEDATKPTAALKAGVDADVRDLSERLLRLEKLVEGDDEKSARRQE